VTLSVANSYQGGTTVTVDPHAAYYNPGTVLVRSDENLGAASGGLFLSPGHISFLGDFQSNRALTLKARNRACRCRATSACGKGFENCQERVPTY
jgi:hypothetical protein